MSHRILIVEDEPDIREIISYNLRQAGLEPETAEDGEQALVKAESLRPDLIILDLMLPGIDGLEVCRLLKQRDSVRHIPVLMLTAKADEVDRIVGLELGADDYLTKPYDPRELALRVRNVLGRTTGTPVGGGHRPQVEAPFPEVPAADPAAPSRRGGGLAFGGLAGVIIFVLGAAWFMTGREEPSSDTAWVVDSGCPRLPVVEWWAVNDHAAVVRYVQDKHEGDWQPYIRKWTRQHDKMRDIHDRGSTAVTRDGHRLSSQKLAAHIIKIENRLAVIRCLAAAEKRLSGR